MPGQPLRRALKARIRARGGYGPILERIAGGETMSRVAKDYGVSRPILSGVLNKNEKIRPLLDLAKQEAAAAFVDEGLDILDNVPEERDAIAKAKERASYRRWLAGVLDRDTFGEKPAEAPVINIQELHLAALKAQPRPGIPVTFPGGRVEVGNGGLLRAGE